jgi:hypothetical protein
LVMIYLPPVMSVILCRSIQKDIHLPQGLMMASGCGLTMSW